MLRILEGIILDVNSREYTCHVRAHNSEGLSFDLENISFLGVSSSTDEWIGATDIPERYSLCLVLQVFDHFYVTNAVPSIRDLELHPNPDTPEKQNSITQTTNEYTPETHNALPNRTGERRFLESSNDHRPHDALPGDKFWKVRDGAFFGILRGGVIQAKVHEFCQIILNRVDALTRFVSRNVQLFTDWGRADILNDNGKTNMSVKAGKTYTENKQENFTVHLDVGDTGDLVTLKVTSTEGLPLAKVQVFPTGRIEANSVHSVHITRGASEVNLDVSGNVYMKSEGSLFIN